MALTDPSWAPGFDRPDAGDASRLWNIAPRIPDGHRFSRLHGGDRELIDHILLSHSLVQNLVGADAYIQDVTTIGNTPSSRRDATVPDHAPITVISARRTSAGTPWPVYPGPEPGQSVAAPDGTELFGAHLVFDDVPFRRHEADRDPQPPPGRGAPASVVTRSPRGGVTE